MGKGRPKCRVIILLLKEFFPFSYVAPMNEANEGTV